MFQANFNKASVVGLLLFSLAVQSLCLNCSFDLGGQSDVATSEPFAKESESEKESTSSNPNDSCGVFVSTLTTRNDRALLLHEVEELRNSLLFGPVLHLRGPPASI